jgi:hypothetical protein
MELFNFSISKREREVQWNGLFQYFTTILVFMLQNSQFTATVFVPQLYCRFVFWLVGANQRLRYLKQYIPSELHSQWANVAWIG